MKKLKKNGFGVDPSNAAPLWCGRCGSAINGHEFCLACRDFFRRLSVRKVVLATEVRRVQRDWSGVSGK